MLILVGNRAYDDTYALVNYPDSTIHGPAWGPPGSCPPQVMGPMLAP